jgi:hypothetical protein
LERGRGRRKLGGEYKKRPLRRATAGEDRKAGRAMEILSEGPVEFRDMGNLIRP